MLSAGKRWLVYASQPHLPIHALFSVPSVLAYNTREAPCSSLGHSDNPVHVHDARRLHFARLEGRLGQSDETRPRRRRSTAS